MNFLYKLERKWGKYAITDLMRYILFGQGFVFLVTFLLNNRNIYDALVFDRAKIMSGQIWRLITFIFIPDTNQLLWFILFVIVYLSIARNLENVWGSFNFNVYYFTSMLATIIVAFIFNLRGELAQYIHLSLFLSFATLVPNATFMIYFILPVKAKYLLIFYFVLIGNDIIRYFRIGHYGAIALILSSFLGYFIFFGIPALTKKRIRRSPNRPSGVNHKAYKELRKQDTPKQHSPIKVAFHKCTVCGVTELDNPEMEFRYCSKCNGHYEYCMDHIQNHTHIQ